MKRTINITLKIEPENVSYFESWLRHEYEVIDLKILPETEKLYETSKPFQQLVKNVKNAQRERDIFINENN